MTLAWLLAQLFLRARGVPGQDGNCGVTIPRGPNAPDATLQVLTRGDPDSMDLEDLLFSENPDDWQHIHHNCAHGDTSRCRTFGVEHWNLTSFWYLFINAHGEPCEEDFAVIPESCGGRIACGWIEGRLRIVAMEILPEDHELLTRGKVHALPHLFSVLLHEATPETVRGLFMLPALQLLRLDFPAAGAVETLRDHPTSRLRSVQIHGRQDRLHWTRVDLSALCSLDLLHFRAYAIQVLGGTLPNCWQRMTQLRTFYCFVAAWHYWKW